MTGLNDLTRTKNCSCGNDGGHLASCDIWKRTAQFTTAETPTPTAPTPTLNVERIAELLRIIADETASAEKGYVGLPLEDASILLWLAEHIVEMMAARDAIPEKYLSAMVTVGVHIDGKYAGDIAAPIVEAFDRARMEESAKIFVERKAPGSTWRTRAFVPGRILYIDTAARSSRPLGETK
jgi:hypothetical protein